MSEPEWRCPICEARVAEDAPQFPFCSPRCQAVDLHSWLSGDYQPDSLPIEEDEEEV